MNESFKNISITLKEETIEALDRYVKDHDTNRSLVVRNILNGLLRDEGYMNKR